jgi:hypothetical protein
VAHVRLLGHYGAWSARCLKHPRETKLLTGSTARWLPQASSFHFWLEAHGSSKLWCHWEISATGARVSFPLLSPLPSPPHPLALTPFRRSLLLPHLPPRLQSSVVYGGSAVAGGHRSHAWGISLVCLTSGAWVWSFSFFAEAVLAPERTALGAHVCLPGRCQRLWWTVVHLRLLGVAFSTSSSRPLL